MAKRIDAHAIRAVVEALWKGEVTFKGDTYMPSQVQCGRCGRRIMGYDLDEHGSPICREHALEREADLEPLGKIVRRVMQWVGEVPERCEVCDGAFGKFMVDGRTRQGPWALMCTSCHYEVGVGLGTGKGQKYDRETKVKVEG